MISMLVGKPIFSQNHLIMLCGGVGYGVTTNTRTAAELHAKLEVTIYIHTHVREDEIALFGFLSEEEKLLFEELLKVPGVGPKTAILITDATVESLVKAVQEGDVSFFSSFSRVGKKLAQKIIIELKPKLGSLEDLQLGDLPEKTREVQEALLSLGYAELEIRQVMKQLLNIETDDLQKSIKTAMKLLSARTVQTHR
ncbi:MAG TPA: Holliday junction branch migration protein RuvA [Candidatus Saccharimonadia bacterium]|nr:Holliday junction branch migration protein RuvA [Candidatus Saccharimonadia bacterium]